MKKTTKHRKVPVRIPAPLLNAVETQLRKCGKKNLNDHILGLVERDTTSPAPAGGSVADPSQVVVGHAANHLPLDLEERRMLLIAMGELLTAGHPALLRIRTNIAALDAVEDLAAELAATFNQP